MPVYLLPSDFHLTMVVTLLSYNFQKISNFESNIKNKLSVGFNNITFF